MSLVTLREMLLWCAIINYVILISWWLTILLKWEWPYEFCARKCNIPREKVASINFACLVFFKAAIILFNVAPLIALYLVRS